MQLISYERDGVAGTGILRGDEIVDLTARGFDPGMENLLADLDEVARHADADADLRLADVQLLAPVPRPGRIICVGLNYKSHIAETGRDRPAHPIVFARYPDSLVGHGQPIIRPRVSEMFDFEGELAFVIGRRGRHIPRSVALNHVAGYACFNDGSVRDWQRHTSQFMPGKTFNRSGSFGPALVTLDEVGDVGKLKIETRLNGKIMQSAQLDDLLFDVASLVEYLSTIMPLEPGDTIATGTAGGVGLFRDPPVFMKPGDVVEVEIDFLGILRNEVQDEEAVN